MTRINFDMTDSLIRQMDELMGQKGFASRAEFFRYLVIEFLEENADSANNSASVRGGANQFAGPMDPKAMQIAETEKKIDAIIKEHGLEFGIPSEAIVQLQKLAKLKSQA